MPAEEHKEIAKQESAVPVAVVTVSDTRTAETDTSGTLIKERLTSASRHRPLLPLLRMMILADIDAWSMFEPERKQQERAEVLEAFEAIDRLFGDAVQRQK